MTTKRTARIAYWDTDTLYDFVQFEARNQRIKDWRDAHPSKLTLNAAEKFEDDLQAALEKWQRTNLHRFTDHPDGIPYQPEELMDVEGPYLAYMTITGTGVTIMDGEWDHFFHDPGRDLRDLSNYLDRSLKNHADEGKKGGLAWAISQDAYVTSGQQELDLEEERQRVLTEKAHAQAMEQWRGETEDPLFGTRRAAQVRKRAVALYQHLANEERFVKEMASVYARLLKTQAAIQQDAANIHKQPFIRNDSETVGQAADILKKWLSHYRSVKFVAENARNELAGQLAYDLEAALKPEWALDMAKWKKKPTMVVVPLVKRDGKQVILKIKLPNIHSFTAQIGVPGSTIKFNESYATKDMNKFMHDAKTFMGQLLRLR